MTTYRVKHNKDNPYTKLDKGFLHSPNLSAKAKGILAYLLSLPDDWKICLSHLVKVFSYGEASLRSGLGELKKAGYLTKASVRDQKGQIVSWVTDVYETPHHINRDSDHNGNFNLVKSKIRCREDFYPDVENPHLDNPQLDIPQVDKLHLETPHLDNHSQLINKDPLRNKLTNPPLPSLEGKKENLEKIQDRLSDCQFVGGEPLTSFTSLASKKDPVEESFSAASSSQYQNETESKLIPESEVEVTTLTATTQSNVKKYDRALGIKEPEDWKTLQQKQFNWVPDGPWLQGNKLALSFIDWLASQWQKQYGGTIHQKRSDVLRHFKKDPANIAISWEQYNSEHLHRYENAALRMHNGLEIHPDEQQQLLTHARAVTNPLPDELNPVASAVEISQPLSSVPVFLPDVPISKSAKKEELTHGEEVDLPEVDSGSVSPYIDEVSVLASIPTDDDGNALNPGAYKQWNPSPIEGEPISLEQWQEKMAAFTNKLSLVKPSTSPQPTSPTELEELNQWLNDPILKPEVLSRVMRSDRYTVEFNEEGKPIRVVEVINTSPPVERNLSKNTH